MPGLFSALLEFADVINLSNRACCVGGWAVEGWWGTQQCFFKYSPTVVSWRRAIAFSWNLNWIRKAFREHKIRYMYVVRHLWNECSYWCNLITEHACCSEKECEDVNWYNLSIVNLYWEQTGSGINYRSLKSNKRSFPVHSASLCSQFILLFIGWQKNKKIWGQYNCPDIMRKKHFNS